MRTIDKEGRKDIFNKADLRKLKNLELQFKEIDYKGQRLILCYNEERAEKIKFTVTGLHYFHKIENFSEEMCSFDPEIMAAE